MREVIDLLKQAVKDASDNKDIDLPEELYEVFCAIQNQAITTNKEAIKCPGANNEQELLSPDEIENITENIALSYIGTKAELAKPGDLDREVKGAIAEAQVAKLKDICWKSPKEFEEMRLYYRAERLEREEETGRDCPKCGLCGGVMSKNPHKEAGKPSSFLTVSTEYVCIPCTLYAFANQLHKILIDGEVDG